MGKRRLPKTLTGVLKICTKCKESWDTSLFNNDKEKPDGLCSWCVMCRKNNAETYYERNKDQIRLTVQEWRDADKQRSKDSYRNSRYNLLPGAFQQLVTKQDNRCAVCRLEFTESRPPHIDHDHKCCPVGSMSCGKCIRGLLCHACNKGLGYFRDSADNLESAIAYLKRSE